MKILIEGKIIILRELALTEINTNYLRWMNDKEVNRYLESRFKKWTIKDLLAYVKNIKKNTNCIFFAILLKEKQKHIGNIKIGPINEIHKFAEIGILIGEKSERGKGIASQAIKLVIDYAFHVLKLHKLTAGVYANNIASIKSFQKCGFEIEGIRKKHYRINKNKFTDGIILGLLNKNIS